MARVRRKISVSIDGDLVRRVERLAAAMHTSVSRVIETQIRDGLEQEELAVKVLTDSAVGPHLAKLAGNPEFLRGIVKLLGEDLADDQLKLFSDRMASAVVHTEEPAVVHKMRTTKKAKKR